MKSFLKKFPKLYNLLQRIYYCFRKFIETKVLGSKFQEIAWKRNSKYGMSEDHPHRTLLVEKIKKHNPETILEVGSASGPNLVLLSSIFPEAEIKGIDINLNFVKLGNKSFQEKNISNVKLLQGKADSLPFEDKSFDVVFTDAVLIHIGPDKIKKVASELKRVAKKALILLEHHSEEKDELGFYNNPRWLRNYRKLFNGHEIRLTKISSEDWGGDWGRVGYIIEVKL